MKKNQKPQANISTQVESTKGNTKPSSYDVMKEDAEKMALVMQLVCW
ncbi:MAG: hypothetical protein ABJF11_04970 [Reichenbachiella sp.]